MMGVDGRSVVNTPWGWTPVEAAHGVKVMSVAFMLNDRAMPVVWRGPRKTQMILRYLRDVYWGMLDYLIIDTPPGTSDEHLTVATALKEAKLDGCLLVTTPQDVAADVLRRQISFCAKLRVNVVGLVENMAGFVCPCCGDVEYIFGRDAGQRLANEYKLRFLGGVPLDAALGRIADTGATANLDKEATLTPGMSSIRGVVANLKEALTAPA